LNCCRMDQPVDGQSHGPIFSPFVMESGIDKLLKPSDVISRRSVVPDLSRASGMRPNIPPRQRYRVIQPVAVMRSTQSPAGRQMMDTRYRRPKHANGEGEILGANTVMRPFAKSAQILPTKTKKRIFYEDGDDETLAERILAQREQPPPKLTRKTGPIVSGQELDDRGMQMHIGRNIEVPAQPSTSRLSGGNDDEFEVEVDIDGVEDDAPRLSPNNESRIERLDMRGASLREGGTVGGYQPFGNMNKMRATTQAVKQLHGENSYLKDQLDACFYRIKQLETLLMDRNMRLKQLLSENLKQSTKIRRLEQELGEDAANEILAAMDQEG
ncbi:hypothetical protein PENTCL1PPCAC_26927, partial [Pristionchus entomophagus]